MSSFRTRFFVRLASVEESIAVGAVDHLLTQNRLKLLRLTTHVIELGDERLNLGRGKVGPHKPHRNEAGNQAPMSFGLYGDGRVVDLVVRGWGGGRSGREGSILVA